MKCEKKKWIFACLVLVVALYINYQTETIPATICDTSDENGDIKVLCYNIKSKSVDYKEKQLDIAIEILRESPDIAYLCEYKKSLSEQLDSIMTQVGHYKSYYRKRTDCIFYSKYEIDSITAIEVETSNSKSLLNNKVHVKTPYGIITIIGCHLSSSSSGIVDSNRSRKREADSIYRVCMQAERPLIVMGDMNDVSGSYPINRIKEAGLKDAWWEGGCGYGATFHGNGLRLRIDHILYDYEGLELMCVKVIDNDLSDHNALMASFRIKKKQNQQNRSIINNS